MMMLRLILATVVLCAPSLARADYFVWQDVKTGLSLSYPDTWEMKNNTNPTTIATIMGPSGPNNGQPVCKVSTMEDRRYTMYPAEYGDAVQKVAVSMPFWKEYLARYDDYTIGSVYNGASLGRWFASYALASYNVRFGTAYQARRGVMYASLYGPTMYVVECSALEHDYERWDADFRGIIKSIDFKKAYHELPSGEYANFLDEAEQFFWAPQGPRGTTAY